MNNGRPMVAPTDTLYINRTVTKPKMGYIGERSARMKRFLDYSLLLVTLLVGTIVFIVATPAILLAFLCYAPVALAMKLRSRKKKGYGVIYVEASE